MKKKKPGKKVDMSKIKMNVKSKLSGQESGGPRSQILEQRAPLEGIAKMKHREKNLKGGVQTGVPGFDELFSDGIPKGSNVVIAGGTGSGKTIMCLQILAHHASRGKKCLYISLEENEDRLKQHMEDFGWNPGKLVKSGNLLFRSLSSYMMTRNINVMLAKERPELFMDLESYLLKGFRPDFVVLDSLTALSSIFTGREYSYRIYAEELFRFFENMGSTNFFISETKQIPEIFSTSGVEEFLADGVVILYNIRKENMRENAIEVLKMRGEKHQKKIVAMRITDKGIVVYPDQEVFGGFEEK